MRDYVLPDFSSIKKGFCKVRWHLSFQRLITFKSVYRATCVYITVSVFSKWIFLVFFGLCQPREEMLFSGKYKTGEQILRLANERFAVPEMLFHPSDIGIQEMGIPEAIVHSIQSLPDGQLPFRFHSLLLKHFMASDCISECRKCLTCVQLQISHISSCMMKQYTQLL